MNQEITRSLTDILTNVSELQTALMAEPGAEECMDRLHTIRRTAMGVLNSSWQDELCAASREEAIDQADRLCMLMAEHLETPMPDSALFRIGAGADALARHIRRYATERNHAAVARLAEDRNQKSEDRSQKTEVDHG